MLVCLTNKMLGGIPYADAMRVPVWLTATQGFLVTECETIPEGPAQDAPVLFRCHGYAVQRRVSGWEPLSMRGHALPELPASGPDLNASMHLFLRTWRLDASLEPDRVEVLFDAYIAVDVDKHLAFHPVS